MADKKEDFSVAGYVLGIVSIVLAFFTPLAGLILAIVGINLSKKQDTYLSRRGKKLSQIGLIISIIVLIITIIVAIVASTKSGLLGNFPVQ